MGEPSVAIRELWVEGYRSLRSLRLAPSHLSVFVGPNGVGKSNLYRALQLLASTAHGGFAARFAAEGGMPSALWAGPRRKGPVRMKFGVVSDDWSYELHCGLPQPTEAAFKLDPIIKSERVELRRSGAGPVAMLERKGPGIWLRDRDGRRDSSHAALLASEAALGRRHDPGAYPELAYLSGEMRGWRFYHHFRTDPDSPIRMPRVGTLTPTLDADGHDLAATLKTKTFIDRSPDIDEAIEEAFPGCRLNILEQRGRYEVALQNPGFTRPFEARELSDGTLRYLCLLGALMSLRLPRVIALNEPETSLHADLLPPLANLIARASERAQLWVITHSPRLAALIGEVSGEPPYRLAMQEGETVVEGLRLDGTRRED